MTVQSYEYNLWSEKTVKIMTQCMKLDSVVEFVTKYRTAIYQIILKCVIFNCVLNIYIVRYNLEGEK